MGKKNITRILVAGAMLLGTIAFTTSSVEARHGKRVFTGRMDGFQEVPSISSLGHGRLWLRASRDEQVIDYKLSYSGLSSPVTPLRAAAYERRRERHALSKRCGGRSCRPRLPFFPLRNSAFSASLR